jgi:hypothetical protein
VSTNKQEPLPGELTPGFLQKIIGRHRGVLIFGRKVIDDIYIRDHEALIAEVGRLRRELEALQRRSRGRSASDRS